MIIKLESGKELTWEEVKEVIDRFQELFGKTKEEYIPTPIYVYPTYPVTPEWSYLTKPTCEVTS